ncbi:hypothetical protein B0H13DRAFT_1955576 [Mycena leptocephala]|nr:hypothetical protein B0H13DRAFT_1955576 [Mycena leptocephala]
MSALFFLVARSLLFQLDRPTQCDKLQVSWSGGSGAGYYLSIIPQFGVPRNISIPSTDVDGTFSITPLQLAAADKFVLTLSDATGFGAGGSTGLLSVGNSLGGSSCDTAYPNKTFDYSFGSNLVQCQPFEFTDYNDGVPPFTIFGVIPGGDSIVLNVPAGRKTFTWSAANVFNGTTIIWLMVDSTLNQGGSILSTVGLSGDASCIDGSAPTTSSSTVPATPRSNIGAIAGSVLGALIFLAVLITLGLFFLRQRQEKKNARMAGGSEFRRTSRPMNSELDLSYGAHQNVSSYMPTPTSSSFNVNQFPSFQGASPPVHYQPHSRYLLPESENPFDPPPQSASSPLLSDAVSAGQRKSGMSGLTGYKPSRYIVHTDAEDEDFPPNEDGVVELPPQYSATRGHAKGGPGPNTLKSPPL